MTQGRCSVFFFKQKTAYEMRISDWSSDVCSSDLGGPWVDSSHGSTEQGGRLTLFERFTDRARRVVVLAQEEARLLNHNYIGTEHILLGLIHEGEGVAAKALESLGISLDRKSDA